MEVVDSSSLNASFSYSPCSDHKSPGKELGEGFCWVSVLTLLSEFHISLCKQCIHFNLSLSSLKDLWLVKRLLLGSVL